MPWWAWLLIAWAIVSLGRAVYPGMAMRNAEIQDRRRRRREARRARRRDAT